MKPFNLILLTITLNTSLFATSSPFYVARSKFNNEAKVGSVEQLKSYLSENPVRCKFLASGPSPYTTWHEYNWYQYETEDNLRGPMYPIVDKIGLPNVGIATVIHPFFMHKTRFYVSGKTYKSGELVETRLTLVKKKSGRRYEAIIKYGFINKDGEDQLWLTKDVIKTRERTIGVCTEALYEAERKDVLLNSFSQEVNSAYKDLRLLKFAPSLALPKLDSQTMDVYESLWFTTAFKRKSSCSNFVEEVLENDGCLENSSNCAYLAKLMSENNNGIRSSEKRMEAGELFSQYETALAIAFQNQLVAKFDKTWLPKLQAYDAEELRRAGRSLEKTILLFYDWIEQVTFQTTCSRTSPIKWNFPK